MGRTEVVYIPVWANRGHKRYVLPVKRLNGHFQRQLFMWEANSGESVIFRGQTASDK
jgi:hypothetical protein